MLESIQERMARVRHWLDCLKPIATRTHPLGQLARRELPDVTGLSDQNVAWALENAFECNASDSEIRDLVTNTVVSPLAHVVLSANVFVAAVRAIAIALASSSQVRVRASRREALTARLLQMAAPGSFELVDNIDVRGGEHLWAYGSDTTLTELRRQLAPGSVLHAHGEGYGIFALERSALLNHQDFDAMALDIAVFDQRGCLSPRCVLFEGTDASALEFAQRLLDAMTRIERTLPLGRIDATSLAMRTRYRETWRYLGHVFESSGGLISVDLDHNASFDAPGPYRAVHVRVVDDIATALAAHGHSVTNVGHQPGGPLSAMLSRLIPRARQSAFGCMQRPPLDGPADRRGDPAGVVISARSLSD
ncbi:MAG: acyl-CoA reductase [Myxococcales bacterium]